MSTFIVEKIRYPEFKQFVQFFKERVAEENESLLLILINVS